jgi:hypothetical protein
MEHIVAAHPHIAGKRVSDGVVAHVSHVQLAAGIGQHLEHVIFGLFGRVGYVERGVLGPPGGPLLLDFLVVKSSFGDIGSFGSLVVRDS